MRSLVVLLGLFVLYLAALFLVAAWTDRAEQGPSPPSRTRAYGLLYALALGVYFTGWSYFESGEQLFDEGLLDMAFSIGGLVPFLAGAPLLLRAVRVAKRQGVTTLPGWLAARYGYVRPLSLFATAFLIVGSLPYIALQLEALNFSFAYLTGSRGDATLFVFLVTVGLALFAAVFGASQRDPAQRRAGLVMAMALSALLKLVAIAAVAVAGVLLYGKAFPDLSDPNVWPHLTIGSTPQNGINSWFGYFVFAMGGLVMFPHMFHLTVVETISEAHLYRARWAFPLYIWCFYLAIIPLALAGVALGLQSAELRLAVLALPLHAGWPPLLALAYLGGLAATVGMAVVMLIALSNLVMIEVVLPPLAAHAFRLAPFLAALRVAVLFGVALLAFALWHAFRLSWLWGFGVTAYIAMAQFAPAFFLGVLWPRLSRQAIAGGLLAGAAMWLYTSFLPRFDEVSPALKALTEHGPWGLAWLRPHSLFGMQGLDPSTHAFFWSMGANLAVLALVMLRQPQDVEEEERVREMLAGESPLPALSQPLLMQLDEDRMEALLVRFLGPQRAAREMPFLHRDLVNLDLPAEVRQYRAREDMARLLGGPLGVQVAQRVLLEAFPVSELPARNVLGAYQELRHALHLSQIELAERLQELAQLNTQLEERVRNRTEELAEERDRLAALNVQLERALLDLRALDTLKGTFLNAVSHDLRIPLTGIMGYLELLEESKLSAGQREFVQNTMQAARRMTALLNELLDFARFEAGKFKIDVVPVDYAEMLDQALATFQPAIEKGRLTLEVVYPERAVRVLADPNRVIQVLSNLLSNAVKFTAEGGRIQVRGVVRDQLVETSVSNTGSRISPEDLPHIFEPFFQTARGRSAGGSGLGLSISKNLIEAHGGTVAVESGADGVTTFRFTLPLAPGDET